MPLCPRPTLSRSCTSSEYGIAPAAAISAKQHQEKHKNSTLERKWKIIARKTKLKYANVKNHGAK